MHGLAAVLAESVAKLETDKSQKSAYEPITIVTATNINAIPQLYQAARKANSPAKLAGLTSSVYNCTLALRCASRLIIAWTDCWAPLASPETRSHTSMMAAQSSEVRFSSVALAARQGVSNCETFLSLHGDYRPAMPRNAVETYRRPHRKAREPVL